MRTTFVALTLAALLGSGCGSDSESWSTEVAQLEGHVDDTEQALAAHAEAIASAHDLGAVALEENAFMNDAMPPHMDGMQSSMERMGSCSDDDGYHPSMGAMKTVLAEMRADCAEHRDLMLAAGDLDAAHAEEARHQELMRDRIEAMRDGTGDMMGGGMMGDGMMGDGMMGDGMMEGGMMGGHDMTCPSGQSPP